jgi:hypothetical protein
MYESLYEIETDDESIDNGEGVYYEFLRYEGVTYSKKRSNGYFILFKKDIKIGEWIENNGDGWINWESVDFYNNHINNINYGK